MSFFSVSSSMAGRLAVSTCVGCSTLVFCCSAFADGAFADGAFADGAFADGAHSPWRIAALHRVPASIKMKGDVRITKSGTMKSMPLSGEAIRMMNYVDDVSTTLRRILSLVPTLTPDER